MNFQQLKIIREAARRDYNLTEVANMLYTSQSGVSRHIRELEEELGIEIFIRRGKRLLGMTEPGKALLTIAERILNEASNVRRLADLFTNDASGVLTIATTHTQARYVLPEVVKEFKERFPKVNLILQQADPETIAQMVIRGQADIGIATESLLHNNYLRCYRYYDWTHRVIVPSDHELAGLESIDLPTLASYPIVTYHGGFTGRGAIDKTFSDAGLEPDIVLAALDADVISTYVGLGLGIGIIAEMAFEPSHYQNLTAIPVDHFGRFTSWMAVRDDAEIRQYGRAFMELCQKQFSQ